MLHARMSCVCACVCAVCVSPNGLESKSNPLPPPSSFASFPLTPKPRFPPSHTPRTRTHNSPGGASGFRPGNARDIFAQMFGGMGGFGGGGDDDDEGGGMRGMGGMGGFGFPGMGGGGGGMRRMQREPQKVKGAPCNIDLACSLEDLFTGTTKKLKITRKRNGKDEPKIVEVEIKPGWRAGTKITFENEGDEKPNEIPSDIVFTIQEKPHPIFTRVTKDLYHKRRITLTEALCGIKFEITGTVGCASPGERGGWGGMGFFRSLWLWFSA